MNNVHYISSEKITIKDIDTILNHGQTLALSEESKLKIEKCRVYLDQKMLDNDTPIYGINTGFGVPDRIPAGIPIIAIIRYIFITLYTRYGCCK